MNYELNKKLKDSGYPFKSWPSFAVLVNDLSIPSLSQLIEACGDGFSLLNKAIDADTVDRWRGKNWHAHSNLWDIHVFGTSKEEAVANLWLALQLINN